MSWTAKVNYVKDIPTGTYVSYGRTWQADRTTRVATITCGYADGYQAGAAGECLFSDLRHTVGNYKCRQPGTVLECFFTDRFQTAR